MFVKNQLPLAIALIASYSMSSHAVYNLYKKDDLTLDINGEINLAFKKDEGQTKAISDGTPEGDILRDTMLKLEREKTDRRVRLGQESGASWLEFRGSQILKNDWRVTGTVGFGYYDSATGMYLSNANLVMDKKNTGSVAVGRQYLHNVYVPRTHTYTPLDTFAGRSVRLDYTAIENLHVSGYYAAAESPDVRLPNDNQIVEGFGTSFSYVQPLSNNQSMRVAAGYSSNRKNPTKKEVVDINKWQSAKFEQYTIDQQSGLMSLEYKNDKFLAAADFGRQQQNVKAAFHDKIITDYYGLKLGYAIMPTLTITAGYGKKDSAAQVNGFGKSGKHPYHPSQHCQALKGNYCQGTFAKHLETFLFDKSQSNRQYVQADYYLRDNVRLYGRMEKQDTRLILDNKEYYQIKDTNYRAGLSFLF